MCQLLIAEFRNDDIRRRSYWFYAVLRWR